MNDSIMSYVFLYIFSSVFRCGIRPRVKAGALKMAAEVMKFMINLLKCKMNL